MLVAWQLVSGVMAFCYWRLTWAGKQQEASKEFEFELDSPSTILPLANDAQLSGELQSIHGVVVHAVGCLLIAEHSYFSMQHGHCGWQESVSLAVEEYEGSGVQTTISEAIEEAIQVHGDDVPGLCEAVLTIIKENRMCAHPQISPANKFLM
ncbi:hypothetical protein EDD16DRAFT_1517076 [Pisolithus croceorrhizus]|nr:hypothetical protein EDD16DRAFT_1517076 [Pisolithus croceorrhizus]KAI6169223.1 hypothetical protein EDD17DRAFT_1503124 [Pisolithus thermaeus]